MRDARNDDDGRFDERDFDDRFEIERETATRRSSTWKWVLGCAGIFAVVGILCCGGIALVGWKFAEEVGNQIAMELREDLTAQPLVAEHLGELTSVELDLRKTFDQAEKNSPVFRVIGTKASGHVRMLGHREQVEPDQWRVFHELLLDDGTRVLIPVPEPPEESPSTDAPNDPEGDGNVPHLDPNAPAGTDTATATDTAATPDALPSPDEAETSPGTSRESEVVPSLNGEAAPADAPVEATEGDAPPARP